ncbi:hypothetical protein ACJIZ3_011652 [Penstemon smallii]|uniref:Rapid alkalinization factor-like n=1 Tax=Penstemon smallii TaxID=265156 RepID=A0ABD3UK50_9LAMI
MANSYLLLISAVAAAALILSTVDAVGDFLWTPRGTSCQGSISECMGDDNGGGELVFDILDSSEINSRRILATGGYISYDALQANHVPCSQRGASYYNCQPGAEANPYTRSCTAATQCRS